MSDDLLKKPVHIAILKPTHIERLQKEGKLAKTDVSIALPDIKGTLPEEEKKINKKKFNPLQGFGIKSVADTHKKAVIRTKLKVIHDTVTYAGDAPPCATCVATPCCTSFVVHITQEEYESGLYGDYAVELTPEIMRQLMGKLLIVTAAVSVVSALEENKSAYFLEGKVGQRCSFLQDNNDCAIYDIRPLTCRSYSCLNDNRVTDDMRAGKTTLD